MVYRAHSGSAPGSLATDKAYPSILHQLTQKALEHYQVLQEVVNLMMSHMWKLKMCFTVGSFTTKRQRLEKGIMAGCSVSVVLFVAVMNLLLKEREMVC